MHNILLTYKIMDCYPCLTLIAHTGVLCGHVLINMIIFIITLAWAQTSLCFFYDWHTHNFTMYKHISEYSIFFLFALLHLLVEHTSFIAFFHAFLSLGTFFYFFPIIFKSFFNYFFKFIHAMCFLFSFFFLNLVDSINMCLL